jgi:ATPase subunit of ABC transporter with duplicated ATPase domains
MSFIIKDLSYIHADKEILFSHLHLSINSGDKIALTGNNGCGKSTLMRILAGDLSPSSGTVLRPEHLYYVPQHFGQYDRQTIAQALGISHKLSALHAILSGDATEKHFNTLNDDWNVEERAQASLDSWGLDGIPLSRPMEGLSGGEKTRIFLAGMELHNPTAILLDEPTNYLDADGRERLYNLIQNSIKKGIPRIMMGALKNNAENSSSRLSSIHAEKAEKLQTEMAGIKSLLSQTDKLKTDFNTSHLHTGKILITARNVNFHYPDHTASPVETPHTETAAKSLWASPLTFQLRSGDRLSLKGKNGSGKTTLLKLIMGELHPTDGVMERAGFTSVYLDQEYSLVRNERSVLQQAEAFNHRHLPEHEVKTILNRYLFPRDVWNKPCGKLSGGEKMRLSFCCLMIADNTPDMFILDEPTNNLDIESIEIITATIRDYAGTVIAISHDREFLKDTGIEREILLE